MEILKKEHPNPQFERKTWQNLNGLWDFEIDRSLSGEDRGLIEKEHLERKIVVPFCPESKLSGIEEKDFMLCVWYKKKITLSEKELAGKVFLHIGACDFLTTLWVNGIPCPFPHKGGYASFSYDITPFAKAGENIITIRALDDTRSPRQMRGKQSEKLEGYRCNYTRTTGIWQTVWLEFVPKNFIRSFRFFPDVQNAVLGVEVLFEGRGDFSAEAFYEGRSVGSVVRESAAGQQLFTISLSEKHLWEVGKGRLYDLKLRFGEDEVSSYFGLREVSLEDGKFLLNQKSIFQRLILDQGYYPDSVTTSPSDEALVQDILLSMEYGFNGARLHQKVFEARFLYHADRLGYLVWGEYGSWGIDHSSVEALADFLPDWSRAIERDFNHPSIIGWCPWNETWDYGEKKKRIEPEVLLRTYEFTKLCDPTRPCIDTSGCYHVKTDIYDVHDYVQDPAEFFERYGSAEKEIFERFPDRQQHKGEPLFMSEYGGIGFRLDSNSFFNEGESHRVGNWSYGKDAASYEEFYARYHALTETILNNRAFMGFCYTQLCDVEQEKNGLLTEERERKFDAKLLYEINTQKAAIEE